MKYDETTYGNGGPPAVPLVAIPNAYGPYFTQGKRYPIVKHQAWIYVILCDRGYERVISMESGEPSAHLPPTRGDWFPRELLGKFEIIPA